MQSDKKEYELHEIEGTITNPRSETGEVEVKVRCGPCINGRHNECNLTNCICAANNHLG
jgi:hypothetical protein